ncbi:hypothetical protein COK91_16285 [Bacillus cereus]|nr:hypothetical protein COK91_16285 [Bacillus cereus]
MKNLVNTKEIQKIVEHVLKDIKKEVKEEVKKKVKEKISELKEEIQIEVKKEIQEENQGEKKQKNNSNIFTDIMILILYLSISIVCFYIISKVFMFLDNSNIVLLRIPGFMMVVIGLVIGCYKIVINFYRLKQNKSTMYIYGLFELGLGMITILIAMLSAIPKEEFGHILNSIKVYLYFYGGIYVAVRGLETMKKHYDNIQEKPIIYREDISKERKLEKILYRKFNSK